jgi:hypothetical protein
MPAGANPLKDSQVDMAGLTGTGDLGKVYASRIWREAFPTNGRSDATCKGGVSRVMDELQRSIYVDRFRHETRSNAAMPQAIIRDIPRHFVSNKLLI